MQKLIPKLFLTNHAGNPIPFIAIGIKENEKSEQPAPDIYLPIQDFHLYL